MKAIIKPNTIKKCQHLFSKIYCLAAHIMRCSKIPLRRTRSESQTRTHYVLKACHHCTHNIGRTIVKATGVMWLIILSMTPGHAHAEEMWWRIPFRQETTIITSTQFQFHGQTNFIRITVPDGTLATQPCKSGSKCMITTHLILSNGDKMATTSGYIMPERTATWEEISTAVLIQPGLNNLIYSAGTYNDLDELNRICLSLSIDTGSGYIYPPNIEPGCLVWAPPPATWCAPAATSTMTFDFGTIIGTANHTISKNLNMKCSGSVPFIFKLVSSNDGSIDLSNGMKAKITANAKTLGSTITGRSGTFPVEIAATLMGTGKAGPFTGSSVLLVSYP